MQAAGIRGTGQLLTHFHKSNHYIRECGLRSGCMFTVGLCAPSNFRNIWEGKKPQWPHTCISPTLASETWIFSKFSTEWKRAPRIQCLTACIVKIKTRAKYGDTKDQTVRCCPQMQKANLHHKTWSSLDFRKICNILGTSPRKAGAELPNTGTATALTNQMSGTLLFRYLFWQHLNMWSLLGYLRVSAH